MTLESWYLIAFIFGFVLSLVSFLGQTFHFGGHVPHLGDQGHAGHIGHTAHAGDGGAHGGHGGEISAFNLMTATAFLAWFGGTGYLLERYSGLWIWIIFALAVASGLSGAWLVLVILRKLLAHERNLDPADYDMVGVLGRISSPVHPAGVGEIIFSQQGVRHAAAARSEDSRPIAKGEEVIVTRYENGIAYVRRWEDALQRELPARE